MVESKQMQFTAPAAIGSRTPVTIGSVANSLPDLSAASNQRFTFHLPLGENLTEVCVSTVLQYNRNCFNISLLVVGQA
jgi:hypothetical protein